MRMTFQEIRIIATGPCITNQLRDVNTICRRSWYIAAHIWKIYGTTLKQADSAVHLGITWENHSTFCTSTVVHERICTARRATYALMGAGLHWVNGINPTVSLHLIRTYWVPRLLYGLEATQVLQKDISDISLYYKWLLKQTQHLPDKTADAAVYLMLGKPPIQAEIHRRIFTIFGSIARNYESVENQLAWR